MINDEPSRRLGYDRLAALRSCASGTAMSMDVIWNHLEWSHISDSDGLKQGCANLLTGGATMDSKI